jgi:hypothetical protein
MPRLPFDDGVIENEWFMAADVADLADLFPMRIHTGENYLISFPLQQITFKRPQRPQTNRTTNDFVGETSADV